MASKSLLDQVAIVTGAASGIGRLTAIELARQGAHVAIADLNAAPLSEVAQSIHVLHREASIIPTDVRQQNEVQHLVDETLARWGRVDILVLAAGVYVRCPIPELTTVEVEQAMAINFYGALYPILAVLPQMMAQQRGHMVLISSMDAKKGLPLDAPYVTAKAALAGFGDVLRQELKGTGISVTIIYPGWVDTPMNAHIEAPKISPKIPASGVARAIIRAIHRRQPEVIIPSRARGLAYISLISPSIGDWLVRRFHLSGFISNTEKHDIKR